MKTEIPKHRRELAELLSALVDGYLDEAGRLRIEELLHDDPDAVLFYIDYLDLHQQLGDPSQVAKLAVHPDHHKIMPLPEARRARFTGWSALAAACVLLGIGMTLWRPFQHPDQPSSGGATPPKSYDNGTETPAESNPITGRPELPDLPPIEPAEHVAGITMLDPSLDDPAKPWCYLAKSTTVIGVPFQPDVTQVTYDGALYTKNAELCFYYGDSMRPLLARQKNFLEGWLPVVQYAWNDDNIRYDIEMFAAALDGENADNTVNFVRMRARNAGTVPEKAVFGAMMRGSGGDYRMANPPFDPAWKYDMDERSAFRGDAMVYSFSGELEREAVPGIAYTAPFAGSQYQITARSEVCLTKSQRELAPGETITMEFKMPRVPVPRTNQSFLGKIEKADYQTYRDHTVAWWKDLLASGATFEFPEKCVQDAQRASLVHVMLATRNRDGHRIQTDGLPYPDFFLTASPQEGMIYLALGHPEYTKELITANAIRQQEKDGLYLDRSLAHGVSIPAAHGHVLYISALSALYGRDRKLGEEIFPSLARAVAYLEHSMRTDPYGLLPPAYPYDNEMIKGHYASNNYWALAGLRNAIRLAHFLGHTPEAEAWTKLEQEYDANILKGIAASAKPDGYVPPGLYPYLTGQQARAGFNEYQTHCDWENMLLAYPTEVLAPGDPRVRGTLDHVRESYAEGIMTYRHGQHLHQYITANQVEQYMAMGDSYTALKDFYHILVHAGPTFEGFENLVRPWTDRSVEAGCPPPHAWASSKLGVLIRNLVLLEYGGKGGLEPDQRELWLFHCLSPDWTKPGDTIRIKNAPTEFGNISAEFTTGIGGASITLATKFHTQPGCYRIRMPYFKELLGYTTDAREKRVEDNCIVLSPDATKVAIQWQDKPGIHVGTFADLLTEYRKANSFAGADKDGVAIIKAHAPFLLPTERRTEPQPLSFALVRDTFAYEYARRAAASLQNGGKLLGIDAPAIHSQAPATAKRAQPAAAAWAAFRAWQESRHPSVETAQQKNTEPTNDTN